MRSLEIIMSSVWRKQLKSFRCACDVDIPKIQKSKNALYTLSGASVRWIDGVLVVAVD